MPVTGISALKMIDAIDAAMETAGVGKNRAHRLLAALHERGLDIVAIEAPAVEVRVTASDLGLG